MSQKTYKTKSKLFKLYCETSASLNLKWLAYQLNNQYKDTQEYNFIAKNQVK